MTKTEKQILKNNALALLQKNIVKAVHQANTYNICEDIINDIIKNIPEDSLEKKYALFYDENLEQGTIKDIEKAINANDSNFDEDNSYFFFEIKNNTLIEIHDAFQTQPKYKIKIK